MPKSKKTGHGPKGNKVYTVPTAQKKRDLGVPRIQANKLIGRQAMPYGTPRLAVPSSTNAGPSFNALASTSRFADDSHASTALPIDFEPLDAALTTRDSSSKAFMRELRKVIERSDVIIQVLDARDPEGTRSKWVEEEVKKRDASGKKLLAVMNKIDLVPRANLEAWLKYLRLSFPCMPFKSSTQNQRQNLSQNAVPLSLSQPSANPGQPGTLPPLPTTSSSLGAPALLHLLKQYSLSMPHSSLTVGVVGYPNVGKSSLINSLKRSRACAVAAMPGKTRVIQEVVLDKGVKLVDCPGVVLEDFGRDMEGQEGRRKQAEIMLRNCVKAELVEDPITPVEVILSKVDPALLQKLYNIPPYDDVRDFLIKVALTRGRLGKGGIPDLDGSAVSVLRDWNGGKIPFSTRPPAVHPSSAPTPVTIKGDVDMGSRGESTSGDLILSKLSEAFTLDGLFDDVDDEAEGGGDGAAWEQEEAAGGTTGAAVKPVNAPEPIWVAPHSPDSDHMSVLGGPSPLSPIIAPKSTARHQPIRDDVKLFTLDELDVLPAGLLDRQRLKQQAKKAKKRAQAVSRTEDELMLGFVGMDVAEPEPEVELDEPMHLLSVKKRKKEKKKAAKTKQVDKVERPRESESDEEAKKEADFAKFLSNVGEYDTDEEL